MVPPPESPSSPALRREDLRVTIIGAGPGGLCMAIKLREAGFRRIEILEKGDRIGGTWNWNRYPGCACDIPSHLYSFSFDVKPDWSRPYAPQPEILAYLDDVAERYDLLPLCRFGQEVVRAEWLEATASWRVTTATGEQLESDVLVSAIGMFNTIVLPDIPGLDDFAGRQFHSSRWDWDRPLTGERVGVIGSAASAVQLVPEIAKEAAQAPSLPAHRELGPSQGRRPLRRGPARTFPKRARCGPRDSRGDLRGDRDGAGLLRPRRGGGDGTDRDGRPRRGRGPGGSGEARADAQVGLQAATLLERLLRGLQPTESRARDRVDRGASRRRAW